MRILFIGPFPPVPGTSPESEHTYRCVEHLADFGLEMHVLTDEDALVADHPNITTYPVMSGCVWDVLPRLVETLQDCAPAAVVLRRLSSNFSGQPMTTFAPTLSKALLPETHFLTLVQYPQGPDFCARCCPHSESL